ncbi:MAG TPA: DUF6282 family protein [Blastocatellia bacterium]|nr:DUF6282 family protein [Blastocatellia bacterium]
MSTQSEGASSGSISDTAWEAIQGAYDLQVHVSPDVIERRTDDVDLAHDFLKRGLRGFVLKSHYVPTAERAKVVRRAVAGIESYGAIALNHSVGGLNPVALEIAGRSGNKIVWMPTVDAANETAGRLDGGNKKLPFWAKIQREIAAAGITRPPITVLDSEGGISGDSRQCLELIAKYDMILATGHLGRHEIFPLVKEARSLGVNHIVITHAEFPSQNLSGGEQAELTKMGAIIEHCFTTYYTNKAPWESVFSNIRRAGVERAILSTDLGQATNPPVAEGFAMFAQKLLDAGFTATEIKRMSATNPASLLGRE